eukprot:14269109-Alexandrium_andersonii.AAC.1
MSMREVHAACSDAEKEVQQQSAVHVPAVACACSGVKVFFDNKGSPTAMASRAGAQGRLRGSFRAGLPSARAIVGARGVTADWLWTAARLPAPPLGTSR